MFEVLLTHSIAWREGKLPFFFSRFKFERMQEKGNTHFCFGCLSDVGYTPGPDGEPTNHLEDKESYYNGMKYHDQTHADFIIGNADKYDDPWDWLKGEIPKDFPCVVAVT